MKNLMIVLSALVGINAQAIETKTTDIAYDAQKIKIVEFGKKQVKIPGSSHIVRIPGQDCSEGNWNCYEKVWDYKTVVALTLTYKSKSESYVTNLGSDENYLVDTFEVEFHYAPETVGPAVLEKLNKKRSRNVGIANSLFQISALQTMGSKVVLDTNASVWCELDEEFNQVDPNCEDQKVFKRVPQKVTRLSVFSKN